MANQEGNFSAALDLLDRAIKKVDILLDDAAPKPAAPAAAAPAQPAAKGTNNKAAKASPAPAQPAAAAASAPAQSEAATHFQKVLIKVGSCMQAHGWGELCLHACVLVCMGMHTLYARIALEFMPNCGADGKRGEGVQRVAHVLPVHSMYAPQVGKILTVETLENSEKLYKLTVDIGGEVRHVS